MSVLSFFRKVATTIGLTTKEKKKEIELKALNGVVAGSPELELRYEVWHVAVMLLLFLNGFLITLFVQCVVYDLDEIYEDFGTLAIFVGNTAVFQRHIFYDVGVVTYTVRIDSHVLSDVVQNFSYVIQLRSELGTSLLHQIMQRELSIIDSVAPGLLALKSFVWLSRSLTRVRFNTVVKLLFELEGMTLAYSHVIRLVVMAQHEGHFASTSVCQHPLLRSDVFAHDNFDQARALSQPNYNLFDSTKELLPSSQPNMEM